MILCGLSTSSTVATIAILREDRVLATAENVQQKLHAERLFGLLDDCLRRAGVRPAELDVLVCDVGPGSFTGVRVGVAAATGIALGLGTRCVGVHALGALLATSRAPRALAAVDGHKGQIFFVERGLTVDLEVRTEGREEYVRRATELASTGGVLVGDVHGELGFAPAEREATFMPGRPDATLVARFAWQALARGEARSLLADGALVSDDPAKALTPIYGRDADATPIAPREPRPTR